MSKNNSNRFGVGTMFTVAIMVASILSSCDVDTGKKKADAAGAAKSGDAAAAAAGGSDKAGKGGGAAGGAAGKTPDKGAGATASGLPNCGIDKDTILIAKLIPTITTKSSQDRGPSMDHAAGQKPAAPASAPASQPAQPAPGTQKNEDVPPAGDAGKAATAMFGSIELHDAADFGEFDARLKAFEGKSKSDTLSFLLDLHLGPNDQPVLTLITDKPSTDLINTWKSKYIEAKESTDKLSLKAHIENLIKNTNSKFIGQAIEALTIVIGKDDKAKKNTFEITFNNKDKAGKEQICRASGNAEIKPFQAKDDSDSYLQITLAAGAEGKWEDVKKDDKKEAKKDETKK